MRKIVILAILVVMGISLRAEIILPQRGRVKSYSSEFDALVASDSSKYFSALDSWKNEGGEFSSSFKVPFLWVGRSVFLHLGAVSGAYTLEINGKKVTDATREFTAKEFDITSFVQEGRNTVNVKIFKDVEAQKLASFDTQHLKIGKDNYVISQPSIRISDINYSTEVKATEGRLSLGVELKSELLNTKDIEVEYKLYSPEGKVVAFGRDSVSLGMKSKDTVKFFADISSIRAWSHLDPALYRLVVNTKYENRFMEHINFDIGFRSLAFEGDNMLINGKKVEIISREISPEDDSLALAEQLDKLKGEGVNFLVLKDAPTTHLFYSLADRKGFYLADRVALQSPNASNVPQLEQRFSSRAVATYLNSKNHTSVVAYILAKDSKNGYNLYQSYLALKEFKPQQAIIYPDADGQWNSDKFQIKNAEKSDVDGSVILEILDEELGKVRVCNTNIYNNVYGLKLSAKDSQSFDLRAGESKEFTVEKTKKLKIVYPEKALYYDPLKQQLTQKECFFKKIFKKNED